MNIKTEMTMKLRLTIIVLAVMTASVAFAQNHDKRMAQIRQAYAVRLEIMKNKPVDENVPFNEIGVDVAQNLPGTGLYERHDKYYFTQEQYSADGSMDSQLYFMTSRSTYAHGMHVYYWEFLWDSMEGDPMFAYLVRQEGDAKQEYRFYFEKGKVIKTIPEVKQWPKDDLQPYVIKTPADVLKLMKQQQATFKSLLEKN